ncbi:MAG: SufD family Fe-S cluster assembly protein [Methanospirillaceae archaeon]|nr:SufD family Fe-S cluster assembly protein [Methanospirillaceae archaeon]
MSDSIQQMNDLNEEDRKRLELAGLEPDMKNRSGSFFQKDQEICQIASDCQGIEVLGFADALSRYPWVSDYIWRAVAKDKDKYTRYIAKQNDPKGFVIIARKGSRTIYPIQACLFLSDSPVQHVHNIIIAEEGAELHVISGCTSASAKKSGSHIGVTEIYIGKKARVTSTMIHNWGENISVFPRSATIIEEEGIFLSNYVCMQPVRMIQMSPIAHLNGKGAVARFSSIVVGTEKSMMDLGSVAVLNAPGASAELLTRAITTGGTIISRGRVDGRVTGTKAHIECKGLILRDGIIHAIPEIRGEVVDTELSHEAAVGKIAKEEIEYLMARGLSEETATATIIRGFLDVKVDGLPQALQQQIDAAIDAAEKSGF